METNKSPDFAFVLRAVVGVIQAAKEDGGATYDRMAANIRARAADGIIEEAIGYVPGELESVSAEDVFLKPNTYNRNGKNWAWGKGKKS